MVGLQAPGVITIDRIDATGASSPTKREFVSFTGISVNTLTGCTRGLGGSTAQGHSSGTTVEETFSTTHWNDLITALLNVLTSAGALDTAKIVDLATVQTLTNKVISTGSSMAESLLTFTDIVTNDVSTSMHGFVPKAPNDTAKFLRGDGLWNTPSSSSDGWTSSSDTWTYASATTFTISGIDRTSVFTKGTRIKLTQTSAKYFIVTSSAFSTDTTVTITGGSDYTLANAAITSPFYSYQANPQGYPTWFAYTPSFTGFSANPTVTAKFAVVGAKCFLIITTTGHGTSNTTGFTITGPINALRASSFFTGAGARNNTIYVTASVPTAISSAGSTTFTLSQDWGRSGAWTSGGTEKSCDFNTFYDI